MTPPSVFVVDDEPSVQTAFIRLLVSAGYQARGFLSARAFLAEYQPVAPGCLILDLQMPEVSGLDLLETLRTTDPSLGVIFVSGRGDVPTTAKAMKMGAVDFLTKPVDDAVLLGTVASASQRSTERWLEREEHARLSERHARLTPREREVCASGGTRPAQQADRLRPRDRPRRRLRFIGPASWPSSAWNRWPSSFVSSIGSTSVSSPSSVTPPPSGA